jgi:hypothetical protein
VVEVARLESVYRFIAYRGFESPSLRQEYKCKKGHLRVAFLHLFPGGERAGRLRALRGDSKASPLPGRASPNRPFAAAVAAARREVPARSAISIFQLFSDKQGSVPGFRSITICKKLVHLPACPRMLSKRRGARWTPSWSMSILRHKDASCSIELTCLTSNLKEMHILFVSARMVPRSVLTWNGIYGVHSRVEVW